MFETLTKEEKIVGAITLGGLALLAFVKPARQAVGLSDKMGKKTPNSIISALEKEYLKIDNGINKMWVKDTKGQDKRGNEIFMSNDEYEYIARNDWDSEIKSLKAKLDKVNENEFRNDNSLLRRFKFIEKKIIRLPL